MLKPLLKLLGENKPGLVKNQLVQQIAKERDTHFSLVCDALETDFEQLIYDFLSENIIKPIHKQQYDWKSLLTRLLKDGAWEPLYIKQSKLDNMTYELICSSDSSVFGINDELVLKIYDELPKEIILKYSRLHNELAKKTYLVDQKGFIDGQEFTQIEVSVLELDEDRIYGNDEYSFSFVPRVNRKYDMKDIIFEIDEDTIPKIDRSCFRFDREKVIDKIIAQINKEADIDLELPLSLLNMNVSVISIEDGTLKLVITDVLNVISGVAKQ